MTQPAPYGQPDAGNLPAGIAGAVVGAAVGAVLWAVLVAVTDYKIGYAAVGVGALTGLLAGRAGRGHAALPVIAAVIALVGIFAGDLMADAHVLASELSKQGDPTSTTHVLSKMVQHPSALGWPVYKAGFKALDVVFYAFGAYAGFRLATQHVVRRTATVAPPAPAYPPPAPPAV